MATDSKTQFEPTPATPVIENEILTYRAISARAVASVVLGLASVFCYTSLYFLLVAGAAILFGVAAHRAIRRVPDVLTGTALANAGIGLALLFGGTAIALVVVTDFRLTREATAFGQNYARVLKEGTVAEALWYKQTADYRKEKAPDDVVADMRKQKNSPTGQNVFEAETAEIVAIKQRLAGPNQAIHFGRIETKLVDGLTHYANALLDLDGPADKDRPAEEFALIELIKRPGDGSGDWQVRSVRYPYKPASSEVQKEAKASDDGHGHSH